MSPPRHGPADASRSSRGEAAYLTLQFGRTQWVTTEECVPLPNTVSLDGVAAEFLVRGLVGGGTVIVSRTGDELMHCQAGYTLHPTWAQLASLRDGFGWTFVSGGLSYRDMKNLSRDEQINESCGSLDALEGHGHDRAWGLFGYPNNKWTDAIQTEVVSTCFAYGRTYKGGRNIRSEMAPPWFQNTNSISGGECNDPALPCYDLPAVTRRYQSVGGLATKMKVRAGEWVVIQMYRFVTGASDTRFFDWDCTAADWRAHWTSTPELYCWNDYLAALDAIPAGVIVTDPATVAEAWGRIP